MMLFQEKKRGIHKKDRKHPHFFLILLILIALFSSSAFSLGLTGAKLGTIIYEPGKKIFNQYEVQDTSLSTIVSIGGELGKYVNITKIDEKHYDMYVEFPQEFLDPGTYFFTLTASEQLTGEEQGIGSLLSVTKQFEVKVYSHEKDILISLSSPSVNVNSTVELNIGIESITYSEIGSVQGQVTIYNSAGIEIGTVFTPKITLPALSTIMLKASFPTLGLFPGNYRAKAVVFYDGYKKEAESSFKIGNLDLLLKNYTSELTTGFTEFKVGVINNWGDDLNNVYAKIFIEGSELLQTPSITLAGWQEGLLQGIIKPDLIPGNYSGGIILYYEGESKQEEVQFQILEEIKPELQEARSEISKKNTIILVMGLSFSVLLLIMGIILAVITLKKK